MKKKGHAKPKSSGHKQPATQLSTLRAARVIEQVRTLLESLCETEGYELIHVEFQPEAGGRILRLYIDKPGGVTLDDCVNISRQANDILDVSLEDLGPYNLEVSSPGPERPLGRQEDFERYKGRLAKLKTCQPIDGQKNFTGCLVGMIDHRVHLAVDGRTVAIPYELVLRARLVESGANQK